MSQTILEEPIPLISITTTAKSQSATPSERNRRILQGESPVEQPILQQQQQQSATISQSRAAGLVLTVSLLISFGSFSTGLLTIGLPTIVSDINIEQSLILWPQAVYALTSSVLLLVAGSIADVLGARRVFLVGNLLVGCFILGGGLARTGNELIAFRACQGVAGSLVWPTSIAVLSNNIESGRRRNIGFSILGLSQALGFLAGLVAGGGLVDSAGWRSGWYIASAATLLLFVGNIVVIPIEKNSRKTKIISKLKKDIDWVGAGIASAALAAFTYVLAQITASVHEIKKPLNIALLIGSGLLFSVFVLWVQRQEQRNKPALVKNSLWKNRAFTSTCLMVVASCAVCQTMELFCSLFFQQVQHLSALQSSIRFIPAMLLGPILGLTTGLFVHRVKAIYLLVVTSILTSGGPLLMATIDPAWPYWVAAFPAQLLFPLNYSVLWTIGVLVVSEAFPEDTQALAGAVFNTVAQLGISIGLAVMGVISTSATENSHFAEKQSPQALLVGYRASFWAAFAWMLLAGFVGVWGFRKLGKVGLKRD